MKLFAILLRYIKEIEEVTNNRPEHLIFLEKYYKANTFILSGRQNPRTGGFILAQARSRHEIEKIIKEDPFYTKKIAEFNIYEIDPSNVNDNFPDLKKFISV